MRWAARSAPDDAKPSPADRDPLGPRMLGRWDRLRRWEYWPAWALYAPLLPYLAWQTIRHAGLSCTASNPSIPMSGILGESKWRILESLPGEVIQPAAFIPAGPPEDRVAFLRAVMNTTGWAWPIVLKPDAGYRGRGVTLARTAEEADAGVRRMDIPMIAQQFHPGPHEAGVFYVRRPGSGEGTIFSITRKVFPTVTGDGRSMIRQLIWRHPRHRAQARVHLAHLGPDAQRIPARGEHVPIGFAGNHCRGTMFVDGAGLITDALTRAFDAIADRTPGIYFGRFDVRYADPAEFAAGRGFRVIELNGLTSESTNIYDPSFGYWRAQRVLREQWRLAFEIGAANRRRGVPAAGIFDVLSLLRPRRGPGPQPHDGPERGRPNARDQARSTVDAPPIGGAEPHGSGIQP